LPCSEDGS